MQSAHKKILFAAGGTGGHLFPAQALAKALKEKDSAVETLFAGAYLSTNAYFNREEFPFYEIQSTTPFRKGARRLFGIGATLIKGIYQSARLLLDQRPAMVIGFGSYHSFPILCAAVLTRTPLVLFESNAVPGRVIRFFSRFARFTALYFPICKQHLKGKSYEVEIPSFAVKEPKEAQQARQQLGLAPDCLTLLSLGGSQGAQSMNQALLDVVSSLSQKGVEFQLIHLTGSEEMAKQMQTLCDRLKVNAHIKKFSSDMHSVWSAADIAICRSGAATLSEIIHYRVPAVLIPYPHAADQHQLKNAQFLAERTGGVRVVEERALGTLENEILAMDDETRERFKFSIAQYKAEQEKHDLVNLILKD